MIGFLIIRPKDNISFSMPALYSKTRSGLEHKAGVFYLVPWAWSSAHTHRTCNSALVITILNYRDITELTPISVASASSPRATSVTLLANVTKWQCQIVLFGDTNIRSEKNNRPIQNEECDTGNIIGAPNGLVKGAPSNNIQYRPT